MKTSIVKQIVASIGGLMLTMAPIAQAAPPERLDFPIYYVFYDFEHDLTVLWNVTRDDICVWAAGGFIGDPEVVELVPIQVKSTGQGALVFSSKATRPIELWDADFETLCEDSASLWASGDAHATGNDNDVFVSGTRGNAFGDRAQGTVMDAEGALWHYSWAFTAQESPEMFNVRAENYTLKKRGK